ncbi:MAG: uroporphyrinogen-III synthase [Sideroxydans sp.]
MAEQPLAGLRIVVTRPRDQATNLIAGITRLGGEALFFPLLDIEPTPHSPSLQRLARTVADRQWLIFISPNAVRHSLPHLPPLPASVHLAAVGQATAAALQHAGCTRVVAPTERFDSEALLALPALQHVAGQHIVIVRGEGGRELLGDTLKARGAEVEYVSCYRRSPAPLDVAALLAAAPHALTLTSSEASHHLWSALNEAARRTLSALPLFVPHPRIATLARQQGWHNVQVCPSGDDGMLAALVAWAETSRNPA